MSMHEVAKHLSAMGRHGDSMLVHMQPREIAGLQRLAMAHGGSLTVNPETGLPEAGFLGDVLGAVAPIALGAFLGPGAFGIKGLGMSALGAGLTTGLLGYALTGDLGKGVMAGLGGGSGASLASSLGAKGAVALTPEVTVVGSGATPTLAGAAANSSVIPGTTLAEKLGVEGLGQAAGSGAVSSLSTVPAAYSTQAQMAGLKEVLANPFAKGNLMNTATLASPLLAAATTPPKYKLPTVQQEKSNYEGPYYPTERDARFPTEEEREMLGTKEYQYFNPVHPYPGFEKYNPNYKGYAEGGDVNETPDPDSNPAEYQSGRYGAPMLNKAVGGLASFADGGSTSEKNYGLSTVSNQPYDSYAIAPSYLKDQIAAREKQITDLMNPYGEKNSPQSNMGIAGFLGRLINPVLNPGLTRAQAEAKVGPAPTWNPPTPSAPMQGPTTAYTGSGITTLPQRQPTQNLNLAEEFLDLSNDILNSGPMFAKGGYLDGPGDGMSDSIPATIAGKQPARLADGEFVVPADVVSHLGNGSTKAGAQRLYEMMDKVRKARTGTTKQGRQINPNKYMPA